MPTTAPSTTRTTAPPPVRATVVVLGDSISRLSEPEIEGALAEGYEMVEQSRDGKTIAEQTSRAALHARGGQGRRADAMLIELGTNDLFNATPDPTGDIRRLAAIVSDVPCVVWHSVIEYPNNVNAEARRINRELRRVALSKRNFYFTDMIPLVYNNPGAVGRDSVHPSQIGRLYVAAMYANDLTEHCRLPPVPL